MQLLGQPVRHNAFEMCIRDSHVGDYVKKPMRDCTGAEILKERLHQLHWEEHQEEIMADVCLLYTSHGRALS